MTPAEIIRKAVPSATDEFCEYVMWERTPFPVGGVTAKSIYKAASRVARAAEHKRALCTFCDNLAEQGKWECARCREALSSTHD